MAAPSAASKLSAKLLLGGLHRGLGSLCSTSSCCVTDRTLTLLFKIWKNKCSNYPINPSAVSGMKSGRWSRGCSSSWRASLAWCTVMHVTRQSTCSGATRSRRLWEKTRPSTASSLIPELDSDTCYKWAAKPTSWRLKPYFGACSVLWTSSADTSHSPVGLLVSSVIMMGKSMIISERGFNDFCFQSDGLIRFPCSRYKRINLFELAIVGHHCKTN